MVRFSGRLGLASGLLNLRSRGSKIAVTVGAVLVIGVSAFFIIRNLTKGPDLGRPATTAFMCTKCKAKWVLNEQEVAQYKDQMRGMVMGGVDCRGCNEKKTMRIAIECPKCKEIYLGGSYSGSDKDICPKCGADYAKVRYQN